MCFPWSARGKRAAKSRIEQDWHFHRKWGSSSTECPASESRRRPRAVWQGRLGQEVGGGGPRWPLPMHRRAQRWIHSRPAAAPRRGKADSVPCRSHARAPGIPTLSKSRCCPSGASGEQRAAHRESLLPSLQPCVAAAPALRPRAHSLSAGATWMLKVFASVHCSRMLKL